jgi:hypothetical protein
MSSCEVIFTCTFHKKLLDFVIHIHNIYALVAKVWKNNVECYELTIIMSQIDTHLIKNLNKFSYMHTNFKKHSIF